MPLPVDPVEGKRFVELIEQLVECKENKVQPSDALADEVADFMLATKQVMFLTKLWMYSNVFTKPCWRVFRRVSERIAGVAGPEDRLNMTEEQTEFFNYMYNRTRDNAAYVAVQLYGSEKLKAAFEAAYVEYERYNQRKAW